MRMSRMAAIGTLATHGVAWGDLLVSPIQTSGENGVTAVIPDHAPKILHSLGVFFAPAHFGHGFTSGGHFEGGHLFLDTLFLQEYLFVYDVGLVNHIRLRGHSTVEMLSEPAMDGAVFGAVQNVTSSSFAVEAPVGFGISGELAILDTTSIGGAGGASVFATLVRVDEHEMIWSAELLGIVDSIAIDVGGELDSGIYRLDVWSQAHGTSVEAWSELRFDTSFDVVLSFVPAPGTAILFAVLGLAGCRRRRSACELIA